MSASEERSLTDVQADVEGELHCEVATELEAGLSISEAVGLAPALDEPPSGELEPKYSILLCIILESFVWVGMASLDDRLQKILPTPLKSGTRMLFCLRGCERGRLSFDQVTDFDEFQVGSDLRAAKMATTLLPRA